MSRGAFAAQPAPLPVLPNFRPHRLTLAIRVGLRMILDGWTP